MANSYKQAFEPIEFSFANITDSLETIDIGPVLGSDSCILYKVAEPSVALVDYKDATVIMASTGWPLGLTTLNHVYVEGYSSDTMGLFIVHSSTITDEDEHGNITTSSMKMFTVIITGENDFNIATGIYCSPVSVNDIPDMNSYIMIYKEVAVTSDWFQDLFINEAKSALLNRDNQSSSNTALPAAEEGSF